MDFFNPIEMRRSGASTTKVIFVLNAQIVQEKGQELFELLMRRQLPYFYLRLNPEEHKKTAGQILLSGGESWG